MRRLLSILLMALTGLPALASFLSAHQQVSLPICCRRAGAHHCMGMAGTESSQPVLRAACPLLPHSSATVVATALYSLHGSFGDAFLASQATMQGKVEPGYDVAAAQTRQQRGPPASLV